jgi:hypothetical protein
MLLRTHGKLSRDPQHLQFVELDRTLRGIPVGDNLTDDIDLQRRIGLGLELVFAQPS